MFRFNKILSTSSKFKLIMGAVILSLGLFFLIKIFWGDHEILGLIYMMLFISNIIFGLYVCFIHNIKVDVKSLKSREIKGG